MSHLRHLPLPASITAHSPLRPLLVHWLTAGIALVVLLPAARSHSLWIGWLPYWLVAAPLLCLAIIDGWPRLIVAKASWARRSGTNGSDRRRMHSRSVQNRRIPRPASSAAQHRRARLVALLNGFPTAGV
ncbi:MAG: hypothetical protein ACT4NL_03645 [Pseudomarimonas sp.]